VRALQHIALVNTRSHKTMCCKAPCNQLTPAVNTSCHQFDQVGALAAFTIHHNTCTYTTSSTSRDQRTRTRARTHTKCTYTHTRTHTYTQAHMHYQQHEREWCYTRQHTHTCTTSSTRVVVLYKTGAIQDKTYVQTVAWILWRGRKEL